VPSKSVNITTGVFIELLKREKKDKLDMNVSALLARAEGLV
jgi:hypothetical protein